jgi:outer membrane receptor protein involved in Fe transport
MDIRQFVRAASPTALVVVTLLSVGLAPVTIARAADGGAAAVTATEATGGVAADSAASSAADSSSNDLSTIVVTAKRLNDARSEIQTKTGASTYTIDSQAIEAMPGGDNTLLNQVILRAPDVAQDSFGQLHIRGEHNGLQYRINGIILPEGISVFSQAFDPRLVESLKLILGALPAEYGLRTAGIIDITTKSGIFEPHGEISLYGGSHNEINPSIFHGGSEGNLNYFVSGDFLRNNLSIESPDGTSTPPHDETKQYHGFGYFEYILSPQDRISWVLATSHGEFQIPEHFGVTPPLGLTVLTPTGDETDIPGGSAAINENQTEITHFGILSYQHSVDRFDVQSSLTARYSSLTYFPDLYGDLLYQGDSQNAYKRDVAYGWQTDSAFHLNDAHTLRAGFYLQHDQATSRTTTLVLPNACSGTGTPIDPYLCAPLPPTTPGYDVAFNVIDNSDATQMIESVYLQDEWQVFARLTLNYGLRYDHLAAYTSGDQVSPRVNFVWKPLEGMTVHGGYSRYFTPPPFELVGTTTVSKFENTSNAPPGILLASPPLPETANYYDLGVEQNLADGLTVGVDSYYKQSRDLIDEGQFGAPIILTPFNYRYGQQYGFEFTASYTRDGFSAYGNFSTQRARGKQWESAQFNFTPDNFNYVAAHYIDLDHEQQYTASTGANYLWASTGTRASLDMLFGSGLRCSGPPGCGAVILLPSGPGAPNSGHLPYYRQVNLGVTQTLPFLGFGDPKDKPTVRFDVINVFDQAYQIRNGTGAGVFAPQYGPRRGLFAGISLPFCHRAIKGRWPPPRIAFEAHFRLSRHPPARAAATRLSHLRR